MILELNNYALLPYTGWITTTIPKTAWPEGVAELEGQNVRLVPGKSVGRRGRLLHVWCELQPGEFRDYNISGLTQRSFTPPPLQTELRNNPANTLGIPTIRTGWNRARLNLVKLDADGPCIHAHFAGRDGKYYHDLWARWYIGQPWAEIELLTVASNVQDSTWTQAVNNQDIKLEWGSALVQFRKGSGNVALPAGTSLGRDQGVPGMPGIVVWPQLGGDLVSAASMAQLPVQARFTEWMQDFGAFGGIALDDGSGWIRKHLAPTVQSLSDWRVRGLGPNAASGDTGAQEDQGFASCLEYFSPGGNGSQLIRYLVACGLSRRPNMFREPDGVLDLQKHPHLVCWWGRPHFHLGVSPDQLGMPAGARSDWHGWSGPDREHWLINTLAGAAILTGSPMLQRLLEDQARLFLLSETTEPHLSTSGSGAPRGVGWTALTASWLYESLTDRQLAEQIKTRFGLRLDLVLAPQLARPNEWTCRYWKSTTQGGWEVPAVPNGLHWVPWEHSIAALGLTAAYITFEMGKLRQLALEAAETVVKWGWTDDGSGNLLEWDKVGISQEGHPPPEYGNGWTHRSGWFAEWSGAAASVLPFLATSSTNEDVIAKARRIVEQVWGTRSDKWRAGV